MISLIYGSSTHRPMTEADLVEILKISRVNNRADNITGMLLYGGGNFLQVLEGPKAAVENRFAIIEQDERHRHIMVYSRTPISAREFPEWEMGFYNLTDDPSLHDLPGYTTFLEQPPDANEFVGQPSRAYTLLRVFRDGVR